MSTTELSFIHRYIPPSKSGAELTLLLLHGTGGNENDLISIGREIGPTAAVLSPRGKILENGMPRFFRRFAEGVFDVEDLKFRSNELVTFVENASATYHFKSDKVVAVGYSNGANIATSMMLLYPDLLAGAILFRPMIPLIPKPLPDLSSRPVFVSAGKSDLIIPRRETERLVDLLNQTKAKVSLNWEDSGHVITNKEVRAAKEWLHRELSKQ